MTASASSSGGKADRPPPKGISMSGDTFTINGCTFRVGDCYEPINTIGSGTYGVVCSARHKVTKQKVAIKKIKPMATDDWDATHTLREIRLTKHLGAHENIVSLTDLRMNEEEDELYIIMELVDTDLHKLLQSPTKLRPEHVQVLMYQLLCGVKMMHENGVLHRDLKPGNLLITKGCELKITDFGLARATPKVSTAQTKGRADRQIQEAMTEYVVTRWYRPPELMLCPDGLYSEAIDMWSVGCIFAEILNRAPLFPGQNFLDQLLKICALVPVPSEEKRGYKVEGDAAAFLRTVDQASPSALQKACPGADSIALDLLRKLLAFAPHERLTVDQALAHPYFSKVRKDWGEVKPVKVPSSTDFWFDTEKLPLEKLKQLLRAEVHEFQNKRAAASSEKPQTNPLGGVRNSVSEKPSKELLKTKKERPSESKNQDEDSSPNSDELEKKKKQDPLPKANNEPQKPNTDTKESAVADGTSDDGFTIGGCKFSVGSKYRSLGILGKGSYGVVCSAVKEDTKEKVAIKKVKPMATDEWDARHTLREIRLMRHLGQHENVVALRDLIINEKEDAAYLVMEQVDTDMHRLIHSPTKLQSEHCRDLKPGNLLISKNCELRITDFGLARAIPSGKKQGLRMDQESSTANPMTEYVVTRWYRPPELMLCPDGIYSAAIDMWSVGCIFAELLNRSPLFPGQNFIEQLCHIAKVVAIPPVEQRSYEMHPDAANFLSQLDPTAPNALEKAVPTADEEGLDLLRGLLRFNPNERMTAEEALRHPYIAKAVKGWGEIKPLTITSPGFNFEFESKAFNLVQIKSLIKEEGEWYNSKATTSQATEPETKTREHAVATPLGKDESNSTLKVAKRQQSGEADKIGSSITRDSEEPAVEMANTLNKKEEEINYHGKLSESPETKLESVSPVESVSGDTDEYQQGTESALSSPENEESLYSVSPSSSSEDSVSPEAEDDLSKKKRSPYTRIPGGRPISPTRLRVPASAIKTAAAVSSFPSPVQGSSESTSTEKAVRPGSAESDEDSEEAKLTARRSNPTRASRKAAAGAPSNKVSANLPPGWEKRIDGQMGRTTYLNTATGEVHLKPPQESRIPVSKLRARARAHRAKTNSTRDGDTSEQGNQSPSQTQAKADPSAGVKMPLHKVSQKGATNLGATSMRSKHGAARVTDEATEKPLSKASRRLRNTQALSYNS